MSRILYVYNDDRQIPWEACWWRLLLRPRGEMLYIEYIDVPGWSAHLDYFDGRNDWTWPYKTQTGNNYRDIESLISGEMLVLPTEHYLDVLDAVPPDVSESSRWLQITRPGNRIHPGDRISKYNYQWPRSRRDWLFGEMTKYEEDFFMG